MRVGTNRRGSYNNGLHQTGSRRCGPLPSSVGQSLKRAPAGEATCSAETAGCTATAKEDGLAPRFSSARSGSPRVPVAGRYGGRLPASALIPEGGGARPGSAFVAKRHHLLQANVILSNSLSAQQGSGAQAWLLHQQNRNATVPQNKALHQTKGVGVPASQAVVEAPFAGERRCWAGGPCGTKRACR